jgi:NADH-quinone oxidoreductase subunit J
VLHADFLALVQLVVYVGAVAVLFLFGLMLTRAPIGREALDSQNRGLALAVAARCSWCSSVLIVGAFGASDRRRGRRPRRSRRSAIAIFADWVLPFELLSMLLLAALIGAIVLARRETGESGSRPDPRTSTR